MPRLLRSTLSRIGYEVLTAADGEAAIEIFRRHKREIGVVLLDIGLPKIMGRDVFVKLREEKPDVVVAIASGYVEPRVKSAMYRAGVEHFIKNHTYPTTR